MVTEAVRNAEIARALSTGFDMGEGDETRVTANTDAKVTLYSMIDGEPRPILRIDAERVLRKRLPDGRPAFWAEGMPGEPPAYKRGSVKCYLHPDFDEKDGPAEMDRAWVDSIGLAGRECNMSNVNKPNKADFRSVYDRDAHMRRAHRDELRIIEAARERATRAREAEERRLDREAMMALARTATATVAEPVAVEVSCEQCAYTGTVANVRRHVAMAHREGV